MCYKKIVFSLIVFLGMTSVSLQAQTLYVKQKTGLETSFALDNVQNIIFSSGYLKIEKTDGSVSDYLFNDMRYLSFTEYLTSVTTSTIGISTTEYYSLYPNPVKNVFYVKSVVAAADVEIINSIGEIVLSGSIDQSTGINVESLSSGVYLCRISVNGEQFFKRFVKE